LAAQSQERQRQGITAAREAMQRLTTAVEQSPTTGQNAVTEDMRRQVREAREAVSVQQFNQQRAVSQIDEVIALLPRLRPVLAGATQTETTAGAAAGTGAPQIVVQEQASRIQLSELQPRVTVIQPEPVVTVRQPQPEIIVRMPQPEVTVQMPQP